MKFNRRNFLTITGGSLSSLFLSGLTPGLRTFARADELNSNNPDHFFVLVRIEGGADVILGLDPKVPKQGLTEEDVFIGYSPDKIFKSGNLLLGPACSPLYPFAKDLLVVNGIFMTEGDLGHDSKFLASGTLERNIPSYPFNLAQAFQGGDTFGVLTSGTSGDGNTNGIPQAQLSDLAQGRITENRGVYKTISDWSEIHDPEKVGISKLMSGVLKSGKIGPNFQQYFEKAQGNNSEYRALAAAFATGGAKQAEISLGFVSELDSHFDHLVRHLPAQTNVWNRVADLFSVFKKAEYKDGSLFDHTTFMVVTDMSRTPALNAQKGKDHNGATNSILMAGKGIAGEKTIGGSIIIPKRLSKTPMPLAVHRGAPFDFETGQVAQTMDRAREYLKPENIARTMAVLFDNPARMLVDKNAKPVPSMIKGS